MKTNPTLNQFKQWSRDCAPAARAVLMAQAYAELERDRVNAYIQPIFDTYGFEVAQKWQERGRSAKIETPRDIYLSDDEVQVAHFFAACDTAHRAHGFTGEPGHCPALRAECLLTRTEQELIRLAEPLTGIEETRVYGDNRKRYLKLLIGACLKAEQEAA